MSFKRIGMQPTALRALSKGEHGLLLWFASACFSLTCRLATRGFPASKTGRTGAALVIAPSLLGCWLATYGLGPVHSFLFPFVSWRAGGAASAPPTPLIFDAIALSQKRPAWAAQLLQEKLAVDHRPGLLPEALARHPHRCGGYLA